MLPKIHLGKLKDNENSIVYLIHSLDEIEDLPLKENEKDFVHASLEADDKDFFTLKKLDRAWYFVMIKKAKSESASIDKLRKLGFQINVDLNTSKKSSVAIKSTAKGAYILGLCEGIAMSNYQFLKHFTNPASKRNSLKEIFIDSHKNLKTELNHLIASLEGNFIARDLVNDPHSHLSAEQLADEIEKLGKVANFKVEVFNKKKIESLKMGGLLAVNLGSINPPTFTILEWKPENPSNQKPIVLVGKGVVYDTGGLSLKPTANSMDFMKSDMAGSAAVIGAIYAAAKSKLNVHVIGLVPATDNRPGGNAIVPGDVIRMYNGMSVEVLNTDAEGRLLLGDALAYAIKYKPLICVDIATLTGAAAAAVGPHAVVAMGTADEKAMLKLKESGFKTYERIVEMPLWDEYGEMIKSDIADIKNIGGPIAGSITAGKFLEHFTKNDKKEQAYPWIHLDIAGVAFLKAPENYRGKNGSGAGVRLLFDFLKSHE